jgi:hypothetical protein
MAAVREDTGRFIVHTDEMFAAFIEVETAVRGPLNRLQDWVDTVGFAERLRATQ